jgi:hypothetical protein
VEKLKPEYVAPLVLYLCSEQCPVSGGVYNAGMGHYSRVAVVSGPGVWVGEDKVPTPEAVAARWKQIVSLKGARPYHDANEALMDMLVGPGEESGTQEEEKVATGEEQGGAAGKGNRQLNKEAR